MGGGGGDGGAAQARADEQARQDKIRQGTERIDDIFSQFDDPYYDQRSQAYLGYATPQLADQYTDAQKQLAYSLDRAGTTDSSIRASREAELQKLFETNQRAVNDQALSYSQQARNNVEAARGNLMTTLNSTADADAAAASAVNQAQNLTQPDTYSPLSQLFTQFTNTLGNQARLEQAQQLTGGLVKPTVNTGLFGSSNSAVKVTK
jgi:hypothetical protein